VLAIEQQHRELGAVVGHHLRHRASAQLGDLEQAGADGI
jgi:hypothetical protein